MKLPRKYAFLFLIVGGTVLLDQITKIWIDTHMRLYETRPILSGFFDLHYIRNPGAAFGFLSRSQSDYRIPFFLCISLFAIAIILYLFHKLEDSEVIMPVALSMVLGGALGNLADRIRLGEVIDFILIYYKSFRWPAFNVADIAITLGVFFLILRMFFMEQDKEKEEIP